MRLEKTKLSEKDGWAILEVKIPMRELSSLDKYHLANTKYFEITPSNIQIMQIPKDYTTIK